MRFVLVRDTAWNGAREATAIGVGLAMVPYMVHMMGADGYGVWLILQLFSVNGLASIAEFGVYGSLVRYLAVYHAQGEERLFSRLYISGVALFVTLGAAVSVVALAFIQLGGAAFFSYLTASGRWQLEQGLTVYALGYLIQFPLLGVRAYYVSVRDFSLLNRLEIMRIVMTAGAIALVLQWTQRVAWLAVVETSVAGLCGLAMFLMPYVLGRAEYTIDVRSIRLRELSQLKKLSVYLFAAKLLGVILIQAPSVLAARLFPPEMVAHLGIVRRVPAALKQLQALANSAVLPLAVQLRAGRREGELRALVVSGTRYSMLLTTPLVVFMAAESHTLLRVWMGSKWEWLWPYLAVLAVIQLVVNSGAFGQATFAEARQFRELLPFMAGQIGVLVAVSLLLADSLGLWAIIAGIAASSALGIGKAWHLVMRENAIEPREFLGRVVARAIVGVGVLAWLATSAAGQLPVSSDVGGLATRLVAVYAVCGVAWYAGLLSREERQSLQGAMKAILLVFSPPRSER